jgi:hypothetical protein
MQKLLLAGATVLSLVMAAATAPAADDVYAGFPVTVKGYGGKKTDSVSYSGQIARHVLHDSLKKLAGSGKGGEDAALRDRMMSYFKGSAAGRAILAPTTKGAFVIEQATLDDISKKKNIGGKTYKGTVAGMPNGMTGPELVAFWIDKASAAKKGVDGANGYDYAQLISKFIMGAMCYNQVVDGYLDENLGAEKKPNDKPYGKGAAYTGKEHSWDEAFGYFGAPAHTLTLTPKQIVGIAKMAGKDALAAADYNKDGKVDLKTEMTFGPAYYAAGFDAGTAGKKNETRYLDTITRAFLDGRKLIANAKGEKLSDAQRASLRKYAAVIGENWQKVLAEGTFKYAGEVYEDMAKLKTIIDAEGKTDKALGNYIKHWGELKGFSLALQTGKDNLGETATRLNRLIGAGPLMPNLSQVNDIDSKGNYVRGQGVPWGEYMLHMAKVQQLMVDKFAVKARSHAITGDLADLAKKLGGGKSAEND